MKKRIFDRVLSVVGIILAVSFAAVLLATIFGGIKYEEFNNSLVKWLFVSMSVIYLIVAALTLINEFSDGDVVREIAINRDRTGSTKATAPVIKGLTKKYIKTIEGVKCTRVTLILTEYGVNLKINVKMRDKDVKETTTYIKKLLDDVFETTLDYKFHSIDFKVQELKSSYEPPKDKLFAMSQKEVAEQKAIRKAKEEEMAKQAEIEEKLKETAEIVNDITEKEPAAEDGIIPEEREPVASQEIKTEDDKAEEKSEIIVANEVPADQFVEEEELPIATDEEHVHHEEIDPEHFPRT